MLFQRCTLLMNLFTTTTCQYCMYASSNPNEHNEPKGNVKSVAADQIKGACQNLWVGGRPPPAPPHATALVLEHTIKFFILQNS